MSSDEVDEKELLSRNPQTPAEMVAYGVELKNHGNTIFGRKDYKGALKFYGKIFQWVNHLDQSSLKGMVPIDTESEAPKELLEEAKALRIGAYLNCAQCKINLKNYTSALDFANTALTIDPNHPKGILKRGMVSVRLGDLDTAELDLKRAADAFQPPHPSAATVQAYTKLLNKKIAQRDRKANKQFAGIFDAPPVRSVNKESPSSSSSSSSTANEVPTNQVITKKLFFIIHLFFLSFSSIIIYL